MDRNELTSGIVLKRIEVVAHAVDRCPRCLTRFELLAQVAQRMHGLTAEARGGELLSDAVGQLPRFRFAGHVEKSPGNVEAAETCLFDETVCEELLACRFECV